MARFQKKQGIYKALYSRMALIIFGCFVVFLFSKVIDLWGKDRKVTEEKKQEESQVSTLEKKQATLDTEISDLKTDRGKEEVIRDKYRVVKDGEDLVVIPEEKKADSNLASAGSKASGFWNFLKEWFGNSK